MNWVYLSPHYDDVVFSCGGLVWEQVSQGQAVEIWTVCAGPAPEGALSPFAVEHHVRWKTGTEAVMQRRLEDQRSCERVGAKFHYLPVPDCIYRRAGEDYLTAPMPQTAVSKGDFLYTSQEDLFGPVHPLEVKLMHQLGDNLRSLPEAGAQIVCPLAIGGHVDHRLTRAAAEATPKPLLYYMDFPYILKDLAQIETLLRQGWQSQLHPISQAGFIAWFEGIAAHQSQISTFWPDLAAMRSELEEYLELVGGIMLWKKPPVDAMIYREDEQVKG